MGRGDEKVGRAILDKCICCAFFLIIKVMHTHYKLHTAMDTLMVFIDAHVTTAQDKK